MSRTTLKGGGTATGTGLGLNREKTIVPMRPMGFPRVRRIGHPTLTSSWLSASTLMAISIDTHGYQHRQVFLGQNLQIGDATLNSRDSFLLRILDCPSCQRLAGLSEFSAIRPARPRALSPARPPARRTSARGMPARRAPARLSC